MIVIKLTVQYLYASYKVFLISDPTTLTPDLENNSDLLLMMVIKCTNLNDLEAYGLVSILAAYKVFFTK
jgi:hypothetical protein